MGACREFQARGPLREYRTVTPTLLDTPSACQLQSLVFGLWVWLSLKGCLLRMDGRRSPIQERPFQATGVGLENGMGGRPVGSRLGLATVHLHGLSAALWGPFLTADRDCDWVPGSSLHSGSPGEAFSRIVKAQVSVRPLGAVAVRSVAGRPHPFAGWVGAW